MQGDFEGYVRSFGEALRMYITEAKDAYVRSKGTPEEEYRAAYLMGFHRVVTWMQQTAESYELPAGAIGVEDIEESYFG